jgi:hypothetical protein
MATLKLGQRLRMSPLQKYPQLANIVFLGKVGETLRQAIADATPADLPEDMRLLLRRLERMERQQGISRPTPEDDPAA